MTDNLFPEATIQEFRIVQTESMKQDRSIIFNKGELTSKATVKQYLTVHYEARKADGMSKPFQHHGC